jgi:hypothetical protein
MGRAVVEEVATLASLALFGYGRNLGTGDCNALSHRGRQSFVASFVGSRSSDLAGAIPAIIFPKQFQSPIAPDGSMQHHCDTDGCKTAGPSAGSLRLMTGDVVGSVS